MRDEELTPVKSLRFRYILGLSAMAVLLIMVCWLMQSTIERQENYGRIINIAGNQIGLANRIAFFSTQMQTAVFEEEYNVARQQVARAINRMREDHHDLTHGNLERDIPLVHTELLDLIYNDPAAGLDLSVERFLGHAGTLVEADFGNLSETDASYVFVTTYGPHVLANLLDSAVNEYERFAKAEIERLKDTELIAVGAGLILLLIEAIFIFWPLERRLVETFRALRKSKDELEVEKRVAQEANRAKTDFLSNMSHELRTPLNAIIGFSDSLRYGVYGPVRNEQQSEVLSSISSSGDHLLSLVNDILDISAAEAGAIVLNEERVPVDDLISSTMSIIEPLAARKFVHLEVSESSYGELALRVDERRIVQVLLNLMSNAVKFTPSGGKVELRFFFEKNGRAGFEVGDDGIGMTQEEVSRATERFGQAEQVTTRTHQGTGLGIPVAMQLMECHGGTLQIDSEKGVGTKIRISFPAERVFGVSQIHLVS